MRSTFKTILIGLVISTFFLVLVFMLAFMGYTPGMKLLLNLIMPPFNIAAVLADPGPPDDLEHGRQLVDVTLVVAWLQIGALAALLVAGMRAALVRIRR